VIRITIVVLGLVAGMAPASSAAETTEVSPYRAAIHLSGKIGPRAAASRGETRAQRYVASQFRSRG